MEDGEGHKPIPEPVNRLRVDQRAAPRVLFNGARFGHVGAPRCPTRLRSIARRGTLLLLSAYARSSDENDVRRGGEKAERNAADLGLPRLGGHQRSFRMKAIANDWASGARSAALTNPCINHIGSSRRRRLAFNVRPYACAA